MQAFLRTTFWLTLATSIARADVEVNTRSWDANSRYIRIKTVQRGGARFTNFRVCTVKFDAKGERVWSNEDRACASERDYELVGDPQVDRRETYWRIDTLGRVFEIDDMILDLADGRVGARNLFYMAGLWRISRMLLAFALGVGGAWVDYLTFSQSYVGTIQRKKIYDLNGLKLISKVIREGIFLDDYNYLLEPCDEETLREKKEKPGYLIGDCLTVDETAGAIELVLQDYTRLSFEHSIGPGDVPDLFEIVLRETRPWQFLNRDDLGRAFYDYRPR
jgi:hypothetical protein